MRCPPNCGHPGCIIDRLHDERKQLIKERDEALENLRSTQVWLICSFCTCILIMAYNILK